MQQTATHPRRRLWRVVVALVALYVLVILALMWWWDKEPAPFDPVTVAATQMVGSAQPHATGVVTTAGLIESVRVMLDKRGGYLSNDKLPPGVLMDNVPNWEFGVVTASRDLVRAMRNDFSRSQTQSTEDKDLAEADPLLSSPNDRWLLPSSEGQYRKAIKRLTAYEHRLGDNDDSNAHFYARADNLAAYLSIVSSRLGSLSQRLSASVGQVRLDVTPAEQAAADAGNAATGKAGRTRIVKTPWTKIDDNFYEARGYTWALLVQLRAIQVDFKPILAKKNAAISLDQVIRELEEAQHPLGSPMVLNGSPFGFFANHSLVMANYVSRANAAVIDLRQLLQNG